MVSARFSRSLIIAGIAAGVLAIPALAQEVLKPTVDADGTVHGNLTTAPMSSFSSPEAKSALHKRMTAPPGPSQLKGVEGQRANSDAMAKESFEGWLKIYPSKVEDTKIAGVHVYIVTPEGGVAPENKNRVLINTHMGGFVTGARYGGLEEAVPLSGRGKIKVIAVDYRMSPEFTFPAASEDMEAVYRDVLKTYKPANVGLFGCSAGGTLVAQSVAWFLNKKIPLPAAVSIQCSGAMPTFWFGGDSNTVTPILNASLPQTPPSAAPQPGRPRNYFEGVNQNDPLVTPGLFPEVLAKFPPSLIVTGTRDIAESNAIETNMALLKAGADSRLFVVEGLGHGQFFTFPGTPESAVTYDVMWKFFDSHLKK
jgi:acetyl esterase/lipase